MFDVIDPGLFTTIQDLGRVGFQSYGVTPGGAMDPFALRAANALVGNAPGEAALEITLAGPRLSALEKCVIAVTGARFALTVDERPMPANTALFIRASATVQFGARQAGARAYLALAGGIDVPLVLHSRATDVRGQFGGLAGRALQGGDRLIPRYATLRVERAGKMLPARVEAYVEQDTPIRIIRGPHLAYFADATIAALEGQTWQVSELADRMGLRLAGARLDRAAGEILSCGVTRGAIQVPAGGQPIILMADYQTTGGYPIIATVIRADLPRLAQKTAGDTIAFIAVDVVHARQAYQELEQLIRSIS
ncbi:MAG: biotin-dependent carboxyltransferase family protein [Anaerolineae bacterium]